MPARQRVVNSRLAGVVQYAVVEEVGAVFLQIARQVLGDGAQGAQGADVGVDQLGGFLFYGEAGHPIPAPAQIFLADQAQALCIAVDGEGNLAVVEQVDAVLQAFVAELANLALANGVHGGLGVLSSMIKVAGGRAWLQPFSLTARLCFAARAWRHSLCGNSFNVPCATDRVCQRPLLAQQIALIGAKFAAPGPQNLG